MSIVRYPHTCVVVHLAEAEGHFDTATKAERWIEQLDPAIKIHAIEDAQMPCWTAHCDTPGCLGMEDDENGNTMHSPAATADDAERLLSDLQRVNGVLLCFTCREELTPTSTPVGDEAWADKQGDVWRLGEDGLMHSYETAPFPREYVEKNWGPLRLLGKTASTNS